MILTIITLFPEMFGGPFDYSIVKRARERKLITTKIVNLRDFATDTYKTVDGKPYGGGQGMILRVDVLDRCLKWVLGKNKISRVKTRILLTEAAGTILTQSKIKELTSFEHLVVIAGHYEGVDARAKQLVDERVSIGSYILTGGELPAMVIVDAITRLIPGVLKNPKSIEDESYTENDRYLEYPQFTAPRTYNAMDVPEVLLGGNHAKIEVWRKANIRKRKQ